MAALRRGAFTCVGWQVTLCDPIWQVTSRSSEMGFPERAISTVTFLHFTGRSVEATAFQMCSLSPPSEKCGCAQLWMTDQWVENVGWLNFTKYWLIFKFFTEVNSQWSDDQSRHTRQAKNASLPYLVWNMLFSVCTEPGTNKLYGNEK